MNERNESVEIQRIIVAVDASPSSRAALEAAVEMASRFQAELLGLFVEDINVLRLAQLPFAHEVGEYSARRRRIMQEELERQLRTRSRRLRRLFEQLAERRAVQGRFRIARGAVQSEIRSAARDADVLVVGRVGWSWIRRRRLGSTARAAVISEEAPSVTLILREETEIRPPMLVLYDGSRAADKALRVAASLVEETWGPLRIFLLADGQENAGILRDRANRRLQPYRIMHQFRALTQSSLPKVLRAINEADGGTLILPSRTPLLRRDAIIRLLEEVDAPVLLVR